MPNRISELAMSNWNDLTVILTFIHAWISELAMSNWNRDFWGKYDDVMDLFLNSLWAIETWIPDFDRHNLKMISELAMSNWNLVSHPKTKIQTIISELAMSNWNPRMSVTSPRMPVNFWTRYEQLKHTKSAFSPFINRDFWTRYEQLKQTNR